MKTSKDILFDLLTSRQSELMKQADAIDVKASVMVVAVTFLAGQSTLLLSQVETSWLIKMQLLSVALQVFGGILLCIVLKVHTYHSETAEAFPKYRDELLTHYGNDDAQVVEHLQQDLMDGLVKYCEEAAGINNGKAAKLAWAYRLMVASFALNILVLYFIAFKKFYV